MLTLNAVFHRKENNLEPKECVVENIIPLSGTEFDRFSSNLLRDWDFIKDNADLMYMDGGGVYHCLLVTGDGRANGILIESEGMGYARYSAHVPRVHSLVAFQVAVILPTPTAREKHREQENSPMPQPYVDRAHSGQNPRKSCLLWNVNMS